VVKKKRHLATVAKIVDRDDDVVFSSIDVDIETWERVWKSEKRSLSVTVEEYDCPYDSISCFADDLCVQCKMDKLKTVLGSLISNFCGKTSETGVSHEAQ